MKTKAIQYQSFSSWKELPEFMHSSVSQAFLMIKNSYAPYSNFNVGAVAVLEDGTVVTGNNQENVSYSLTICAERVALSFAKANYPTLAVKQLIVVAKGDLINNQIFSPCGACRQVMLEIENRQTLPMEVIMIHPNGETLIVNSAADLLPFGFSSHE